jgi:hypothetical protein
MENKTGNVHVTRAKKLVFKAMFYGMVVQIMSKMLRRFFCWWLDNCYEEFPSNSLLLFAYHLRASEFVCIFWMLNLINVSVCIIQALCNSSSINSKSTRLQSSIFGTSIPCDSLVLQLSYPIFLISARLFLSFVCFCCFGSMLFYYFCSWCIVVCSETAMPEACSLSEPQLRKSLSLYKVSIIQLFFLYLVDLHAISRFLHVVGLVYLEASSTGKTRVGINGNFLVMRVLLDVSSFLYRLYWILLHSQFCAIYTYKLWKITSFAFYTIFYHIPVSFRM